MSGDMLAQCKKYKSRKLPESEYFFPRSDGKCYTTAQQDKLFKKCWSDANPGVVDLPNVRTYDLRHRFASARLNRWLDEGADLNNKLAYLRAYMGHKELSETAYYIHILPENLVKSAGIDWSALNAVLPEVEI
jgi:integrase